MPSLESRCRHRDHRRPGPEKGGDESLASRRSGGSLGCGTGHGAALNPRRRRPAFRIACCVTITACWPCAAPLVPCPRWRRGEAFVLLPEWIRCDVSDSAADSDRLGGHHDEPPSPLTTRCLAVVIPTPPRSSRLQCQGLVRLGTCPGLFVAAIPPPPPFNLKFKNSSLESQHHDSQPESESMSLA